MMNSILFLNGCEKLSMYFKDSVVMCFVKKPPNGGFLFGDPSEIRTRVTAVKGRCPRPLDDRVKKVSILISVFT